MEIARVDVLMSLGDKPASFVEIAEDIGVNRAAFKDLRKVVDELVLDGHVRRGYSVSKDVFTITADGKDVCEKLLNEKVTKNDDARGNEIGSNDNVEGVQSDGKSGDGKAHTPNPKPTPKSNNPAPVNVPGKKSNAPGANPKPAATANATQKSPVAQQPGGPKPEASVGTTEKEPAAEANKEQQPGAAQ